MSTVINHSGLDPMVFLTNGSRLALGLVGPSDRPMSVVQTAQEAYYAANGTWPYVDGMPNEIPPPPPEPTTIGTVSAAGDDVTGTNLAIAAGGTSVVTASIDGDADDATYKWTVRSGTEYVSINGSDDLPAVTLNGVAAGLATVRCTVKSVTASDSPQQVTLSATVTEPSGPDKKNTRAKK